MTITEIMEIGTKGMTDQEKQDEQVRRLAVARKVTEIGEKADTLRKCLAILNFKPGCDARKSYEKKIRMCERKLRHIKAAEGEWLKAAAWFMYA